MLGHDPDGTPTLFVLAGNSLGTTPVGVEGAPQWFDLRRLVNLDAVGDPVGARLPVEASFDGGSTLIAMWPEPFVDQVVGRLQELLSAGDMVPQGAEAAGPGGDAAPPVAEQRFDAGPIEATAAEAQPALEPPAAFAPPVAEPMAPPPEAPPAAVPPVAPVAEPMAQPPEAQPLADPPMPGGQPLPPSDAPAGPAGAAPLPGAVPVNNPQGAEAPMWAAGDDRPLPGDGPPLAQQGGSAGGQLTLEDVVYHGGYPGQTKKRKKCVAVLDGTGVTVNGPSGPDFRLGWEGIRSVEAQNADEAKFRLGVKAKRNSTVIVLDCDQGVTIVIEALDVPTMPLKGALQELLGGGPVTVT